MNGIAYPLEDAASLSKQEVQNNLCTNAVTGLTSAEAEVRLAKYGANTIREKAKRHAVLIFLSQFKGPFIILLAVAAALSFWFEEILDGIAILIVMLINAAIGFFMEHKAERSMEALKRLTTVSAKVLRNQKLIEINSDKIVPGDILIAEAGDMILADARICECAQLQVDESALTGESVAVDKRDAVLSSQTTLADRVNMLYKGTFVTKGNVKAIVTGTGMQTEIGHIATLVQSAEDGVAPLEKKIAQFSKKILWLTLMLIALMIIAGLIEGDELLSLLQTAIALSVAAIPEGLPIVTTLALARGMMQMSRQNVIVKRLSAVETLGGTNVICTDKTGTLTQNRIEVNTIAVPGAIVEIKQDVIRKITNFVGGDESIRDNRNYKTVQMVGVLCNTAEFFVEDEVQKEVGDPLETGLLKFAYADGVNPDDIRLQHPKNAEEPFSSDTKIMATAHSVDNRILITAKGAAEELLMRCTQIQNGESIDLLDENLRTEWMERAEQLAHNGLRVIAMAFKNVEVVPLILTENLVFAGLIGLLDPPREDVYEAINECHAAGINVIMITGDHPATAKNIAHKLGIAPEAEDVLVNGPSMLSQEKLSAEDKKRWSAARIFARVTPAQKLDLVTVLQEKELIVAMTGDGVNDAPALKKADIGIAMGQRGTQVAQEVSDMILKDDAFSSIVVAIRQGRVIFENIRRFIVYLLMCNISELLIISFSSIFALHWALFPLQILFINLITDVLPALALGLTEGSSTIMKQNPRNPEEPLIDRRRWISVFACSIIMGACSIGAVGISHLALHDVETWNGELCNNMLFLTLILCQLWNAFNMTGDNHISFFRTDVFRNKYLWYAVVICLVVTAMVYLVEPVSNALQLHRPGLLDITVILGFSFLSVICIRLLKRTKLIL